MKRTAENENDELKRFESFCSQFIYTSEDRDTRNGKSMEKGNTRETVQDDHQPNDPFVAPYPNRYREKYSSPCSECFKLCRVCRHSNEKRLRMLIIGHNPSECAWKNGYMYSNPTNRFWKIITGTFCSSGDFHGVISPSLLIEDQNQLPSKYGIGFTDLGTVPGNQSDAFSTKELTAWKVDLFDRLRRHLCRVCKQEHDDQKCHQLCHSPQIVVFSGKGQYLALFGKGSCVKMGRQENLPEDWPLSRECKVFVCPSSSGRVGMKKEEIMKYYQEAFDEYLAILFVCYICSNNSNVLFLCAVIVIIICSTIILKLIPKFIVYMILFFINCNCSF